MNFVLDCIEKVTEAASWVCVTNNPHHNLSSPCSLTHDIRFGRSLTLGGTSCVSLWAFYSAGAIYWRPRTRSWDSLIPASTWLLTESKDSTTKLIGMSPLFQLSSLQWSQLTICSEASSRAFKRRLQMQQEPRAGLSTRKRSNLRSPKKTSRSKICRIVLQASGLESE